MENMNKLLLRQLKKYLGGVGNIPEEFDAFLNAVNDSYNHYEKDHHLLERSIELSSSEMIELNNKLRKETTELKRAHEKLKITEQMRLEKILDEEKIKQLQEITSAVISAQERERAYLGGELHDNINQILATSMLYIDTAIVNEDSRLNLIKDGKDFINTAIQEIRYLSKALLAPLFEHTGLINALTDLIHNIKQVDRLKITTDWENIDESQMSEKMKLNIFRIIQEQLNNIFKHANAQNVCITLLQQDGNLYITIKDDGVGFDITRKRHGVGLRNIYSRTDLFNGEVAINSEPGAGCELLVTFHKQFEVAQQKIA